MPKAEPSKAKNQSFQALTISVAGERLAIPANDVSEVIRNPAVTRIPLSPPGLVGVANLRGTVIPIVSLAVLLGKEWEASAARRVVVVGESRPVGLMVDEASALERSDKLRSSQDLVRFIDVDALMATQFGAMSKPVMAANSALTAGTESGSSIAAPTESFFSFEIAGQEFALPLASVQEVLAVPATLAVVPRTDDAMLGAITLRGRLLPLVSLATLLGFGANSAGSSARIVVAAIGGVRVGLVVNSLRDIVRATADQIDPVPLVLTRGKQEAQIQSICRLEGGRGLMSILSTDHLFESSLAERLVAEKDYEEELMEDGAAPAATEQFVIFKLGDEDYGLPIACVTEVVASPDKLTKLPKAPTFVEGVMNLRGQIIPVIDQRRRFESATVSDRKSRIVVVRLGKTLAGFVVDGVSEVLSVSADQLRTSPELTSKRSKVIERIANLDREGRMILLIDPQELLDRAEQELIDSMRKVASTPS